jgi:hypothetical protein
VTAFGVVGTIAVATGDDLIGANLVEQARQHRRTTGSVVGYFNGPDFQRVRVNAKVDLAPLATVVGPMSFGLPLTFAQHLDACAVDQKVQSRCLRLGCDRHRKILLASADGTKVGHLPVWASELEQALCHGHRLTQGKIEQALDGQAELDRRLAVLLMAAPLAAGTAVSAHVLVQPGEQGATRLQRRVVVFPVGRLYFGFAGALMPAVYPAPTLDCCTGRFVQQNPLEVAN